MRRQSCGLLRRTVIVFASNAGLRCRTRQLNRRKLKFLPERLTMIRSFGPTNISMSMLNRRGSRSPTICRSSIRLKYEGIAPGSADLRTPRMCISESGTSTEPSHCRSAVATSEPASSIVFAGWKTALEDFAEVTGGESPLRVLANAHRARGYEHEGLVHRARQRLPRTGNFPRKLQHAQG